MSAVPLSMNTKVIGSFLRKPVPEVIPSFALISSPVGFRLNSPKHISFKIQKLRNDEIQIQNNLYFQKRHLWNVQLPRPHNKTNPERYRQCYVPPHHTRIRQYDTKLYLLRYNLYSLPDLRRKEDRNLYHSIDLGIRRAYFLQYRIKDHLVRLRCFES